MSTPSNSSHGASSSPGAESAAIDRQSAELMGYLETLYSRMMQRFDPPPGSKVPPKAKKPRWVDCSREEVRALTMLQAKSPRTMGDLAESLNVPLSTATHTVSRLVEKGLAERRRSEEDRRVVEIDLSPEGRAMRSQLREYRREMARCWLTPLTRGEREIFLELMGKITHGNVDRKGS